MFRSELTSSRWRGGGGAARGGGVGERFYLSLGDDVEGAALLALPDDVLPSVVVFLKDTGTTVRCEALY